MEWSRKEKLEASVNCTVGRFEAYGDIWRLTSRHGVPYVEWVSGEHYLPGRRRCYVRFSNERDKKGFLSFTRPRVETDTKPRRILVPARIVKEVFEDGE